MAVDDDIFNFYDRQNRGFGPLEERPWKSLPKETVVPVGSTPASRKLVIGNSSKSASGFSEGAIKKGTSNDSHDAAQIKSTRRAAAAPACSEEFEEETPHSTDVDGQRSRNAYERIQQRLAAKRSSSRANSTATGAKAGSDQDQDVASLGGRRQQPVLLRPYKDNNANAQPPSVVKSGLLPNTYPLHDAVPNEGQKSHNIAALNREEVRVNDKTEGAERTGLARDHAESRQQAKEREGDIFANERGHVDTVPKQKIRIEERQIPAAIPKRDRRLSGDFSCSPPKRPACKSSGSEGRPHRHGSMQGLGRIIPGPAGDVQQALYEGPNKSRVDANSTASQLASTPAHAANQPHNNSSDEDFKKGPWMTAMDTLDAGQSTEGSWSVPWTSIGFIRKEGRGGRVEQVVGIIKSFTPNELGDAYIELKDPSGNIGGTIPAKVVRDESMSKDLSCGAVLILKAPVVFSPWPGMQHLNITRKNISHVFPASTPAPPSQKAMSLQETGHQSQAGATPSSPAMCRAMSRATQNTSRQPPCTEPSQPGLHPSSNDQPVNRGSSANVGGLGSPGSDRPAPSDSLSGSLLPAPGVANRTQSFSNDLPSTSLGDERTPLHAYQANSSRDSRLRVQRDDAAAAGCALDAQQSLLTDWDAMDEDPTSLFRLF